MTYLKRGAGNLTKRLTIQQRVENETSGASDPYYEDIKTIWASIEPLSGRELFLAQQVHSTASHIIRHRFVDFLEPKHRFYLFDKRRNVHRYFNIERVAEDPNSSGTYQESYVTEWTEAPTEAGAANA
jgi:SPP1 family predicted phage head-tail adaptor